MRLFRIRLHMRHPVAVQFWAHPTREEQEAGQFVFELQSSQPPGWSRFTILTQLTVWQIRTNRQRQYIQCTQLMDPFPLHTKCQACAISENFLRGSSSRRVGHPPRTTHRENMIADISKGKREHQLPKFAPV